MTPWVFALSGLAILATWCPPLPRGGFCVPPWAPLFLLATGAGLAAQVLTWPALVALGVVMGGAVLARRHGVAAEVTVVGALLLSVHGLPGFHNPKLFDAAVLSTGGVPFTQHLNFDKAAAGLALLVAFVHRRPGGSRPVAWAAPTGAALALTTVAALGLAWAAGMIRVEPKWPPLAPAFLAVNLLFTCVAEEAFFRGWLQPRVPGPRAVAVAVSAGAFALVHVAGGLTLVALAAVVGLGCAWVRERTGRVEPAIATHFAVNAVHFVGFTYPALA